MFVVLFLKDLDNTMILTNEWPAQGVTAVGEASDPALTSTLDQVQLFKSKACNRCTKRQGEKGI